MTRHSFIQMSKLSNVKGRISYVTSPARQENLYATYNTTDAAFWTSLARENQQEFKRSGTEGKCIEAREFIIVHLFRNDIIVSSRDDIPMPSSENGAPGAVGITSPGGTPPAPLDEMIEGGRYKSDDWEYGNKIGGGVLFEYTEWDFAEVLSSDPTLRSRRVCREDGAEKMEYTAENPTNLIDTLTGHITFNLSWMGDQYNYVPDANMSFVVNAPDGSYVSEAFSALYAKPDDSGYVEVNIYNVAQADYWGQSYIIDGSYETAYYYASADGYEFLITMHNGRVWADCNTSHASISLYGAYLTTDEVEDVLDNLSLTINE